MVLAWEHFWFDVYFFLYCIWIWPKIGIIFWFWTKIQKGIVDKFLSSQKRAYELKQKAQEVVESMKSEIIKFLIS